MEVIANRMDILEAGIRENKEAHEKIYARLEPLERESAVTAYQYRQIMETLKEMRCDIQALKDAPKRRWDLAVTALITLVVSGVGGVLLSRLFG